MISWFEAETKAPDDAQLAVVRTFFEWANKSPEASVKAVTRSFWSIRLNAAVCDPSLPSSYNYANYVRLKQGEIRLGAIKLEAQSEIAKVRASAVADKDGVKGVTILAEGQQDWQQSLDLLLGTSTGEVTCLPWESLGATLLLFVCHRDATYPTALVKSALSWEQIAIQPS